MSTDEALAKRMFLARNRLEAAFGRGVAVREIGETVSAALRRGEAYDPSVVNRWLKGEQEPKTRAQWVALARALAVDPGWLAFGPDSFAPMPREDIDPRPAYLKAAERYKLQIAAKPARETKAAPAKSAAAGKNRKR